MRLRFQYIMRGHERGTLMRCYLLLSFSVAFLPGGIIETPGPGGLILFTGPLKRVWSGIGSTLACAIPVPPVTLGTDDDLCVATATMIKTSGALHRQQGRWGLNLFRRCVTLTDGRACARFCGMASTLTVKSLWRHTFSQRHLSLYRLYLYFALFWLFRNEQKSSIRVFTSDFLRMGKIRLF